MKVLWFSNSPAAAYETTINGTGAWMVTLDRAIQNRVELHVAYLYPHKQKDFLRGKTHYHPIYSGNILFNIILGKFFPNRIKSFLCQYLDLINRVQPDIIHIHGTENTYGLMIGKTEIPVVISIQGNFTVLTHKYLSGFYGKYLNAKIGGLSLKSFFLGRKNFGSGYRMMQRMSKIERKSLLNAKYIIGRTDWDKRITRILAPNSEYFIGNEILREPFYNNSWESHNRKDKIIIHTTNGNCYYKGFETLCFALSLLNNVGIEVEWRVAGISDESAIVAITKKKIKGNFPSKGLILLGSLSEDKLVEKLLEADIYVMPSHIENSPNNLCEAMILGMPCIATMAGGTSSILKDKEEGLLIQDGDPWSMAGAILELLNDVKLSVQYGIKARETAIKRHSKDSIVNNLLLTYEKIILEANEN